jgi:hypothetical protein
MPEQKSLVVYNDINYKKKGLISRQNPNTSFVHIDNLPKLKGTSRRIGQKMDLWLQAYDIVEDERLAFLDCDMIVRSPINDSFSDDYDLFFTIKYEAIPINTGIVFMNKSSASHRFLNLWRDENDVIAKDVNLLSEACEQTGGPNQHA